MAYFAALRTYGDHVFIVLVFLFCFSWVVLVSYILLHYCTRVYVKYIVSRTPLNQYCHQVNNYYYRDTLNLTVAIVQNQHHVSSLHQLEETKGRRKGGDDEETKRNVRYFANEVAGILNTVPEHTKECSADDNCNHR